MSVRTEPRMGTSVVIVGHDLEELANTRFLKISAQMANGLNRAGWDRTLQSTKRCQNTLSLSLSLPSLSLETCVCVCVCDTMFTGEWSSPERIREETWLTRLHLPLKALCPVAERIVAVVYLASAMLRSFRHSCRGLPQSLPSALSVALLQPASYRRSASSSGPNRPQPVLFPAPFSWLRNSGELLHPRRKSQGECAVALDALHASTSTRGSVSFSVASIGTPTSLCDLSPASQQAL